MTNWTRFWKSIPKTQAGIPMEKPLTQHIVPGHAPLSLKEYEKVGGYQSVRKILKEMAPADVQNLVKASDLRVAAVRASTPA
ncbi:hypothetical protein [Pontibacter sp. BAB1700]|uniref:hypothetical protein n=1 Tax=Pontibacter sp. BAB1700 TaxID=1144253 RepID=UPI00192C0328|nr:hypothetical protein [Pontibacter sp. BAB1700]